MTIEYKYQIRSGCKDGSDPLLDSGFRVLLRKERANVRSVYERKFDYDKVRLDDFFSRIEEFKKWNVVTFISEVNESRFANHLILKTCSCEEDDFIPRLLKHISTRLEQPIETFTVCQIKNHTYVSTLEKGDIGYLKDKVDELCSDEFAFDKGIYDQYHGGFQVDDFVNAELIESVVVDGETVMLDDLNDYRSSWLTGECAYYERAHFGCKGVGESDFAKRLTKLCDRKRLNLFMRMRVGIGFH